jgi:hypothetical protein
MFRYALAAVALLLLPTKTSKGSRAELVELIPQGNTLFTLLPHAQIVQICSSTFTSCSDMLSLSLFLY